MPWDSSTSSEIANTRFMHVKRKLVGTLPLITACQTVAMLFEKARKLLVDNTGINIGHGFLSRMIESSKTATNGQLPSVILFLSII